MEKLKFINSKGLTLVGNLYRTDSDSVVIMAHGFTNNKSSQGRFDLIASALNKININAFTFDFSGCGESDSEVITVENEVDDLKSAIDFMKSYGYERLGLFGNSLGSLICLKCYDSEIVTMVLMGALTHSMQYDWNKEFSLEQLKELEESGYINLKSAELGERLISHQTLKDFEEIDQVDLLSVVKCPVLMIYGNNKSDSEELELLSNTSKGMYLLNEKSKLVIIEGAEHGCRDHMDEVIIKTTEWFAKYLDN